MIEENTKKISCIIPAYNEAENIGHVLSIVIPLVGTILHEVIVVDDMSKDNTLEIVSKFEKVHIIKNEVNQGKSKTVARGIRESTGTHILLLDADLLFLNEQNIRDIVQPIIDDRADLTISYRKNAWPLFPFKEIDYLSGERIFPKKYALPLLNEMANLKSYGLEVFINRNIIIKNKLRIIVVQWKNVENNFHQNKDGIFVGGKIVAKIWWDILCTVSVLEMYIQNIKMQKLIIHNPTQDPKISLVICAYNEENYIGACLENAIKNGKGLIHEIIVVNNNSTDQTKELAEKYPGVRVVDEPKKGQVRARQRSISEVTGNLIAYIDADNHMPEEWINIAIKEFDKNPNLACLSGPYIYYDFSFWQKFLTWLYWYLFAYPLYILVGYMAVGGNFIIRKDVLEKMNGFDTSIEFYGEDTNIARRASKFGKVKFNPNFYIYSSARRLIGQGLIKTAYLYGLNFFSQVFMKKSATTIYEDIR